MFILLTRENLKLFGTINVNRHVKKSEKQKYRLDVRSHVTSWLSTHEVSGYSAISSISVVLPPKPPFD